MFISLWCTESPVTSYARVSLLGLTLEPPFGKTKTVVQSMIMLTRSGSFKHESDDHRSCNHHHNYHNHHHHNHHNHHHHPYQVWMRWRTHGWTAPAAKIAAHAVGAYCCRKALAWTAKSLQQQFARRQILSMVPSSPLVHQKSPLSIDRVPCPSKGSLVHQNGPSSLGHSCYA